MSWHFVKRKQLARPIQIERGCLVFMYDVTISGWTSGSGTVAVSGKLQRHGNGEQTHLREADQHGAANEIQVLEDELLCERHLGVDLRLRKRRGGVPLEVE